MNRLNDGRDDERFTLNVLNGNNFHFSFLRAWKFNALINYISN